MKQESIDAEIYRAKELCVQMGECSATYYIVLLIQELQRLRKERDKAISCRESTWKWCTSHYGKLEDWARTQLPEPLSEEFFSCIANGTWSAILDNAPPYIANAGFVIRPSGYFHMKTASEQLLFDQWKRAEDAEAELAKLKDTNGDQK